MRSEIVYRDYVIYFDGTSYVAETSPQEDDDYFLQMRSVLLQRLIDAIDDLHACTNTLPVWLEGWQCGEETCVNLDILRRLTVLKLHGAMQIAPAISTPLLPRPGG